MNHSVFTLRPKQPDVFKAFREYQRQKMQEITPIMIVVFGIITLVALALSLNGNELRLENKEVEQ